MSQLTCEYLSITDENGFTSTNHLRRLHEAVDPKVIAFV